MATSRKKQQVTKTKEQAVQVAGSVPDFMKKGSARGIETMSHEDFELATVTLLQALSPAVEEKGLRAGFLYHNILEDVLQDEEGENTLTVVPIMNRVRYVLWNPLHLGGGQLACASDGINWDVPNQQFEVQIGDEDPYKEIWKIGEKVRDLTMCPDDKGNPTKSIADFGTFDTRKKEGTSKDSQPAATKSYNFLCVAPERLELGPFIVFLQKTSEKIGKKWNQKIRVGDTDSFGQVFKLGGQYEDRGPKKKFWMYSISNAGFVQDEQQYLFFESLYERYTAIDAWNIKEDDQNSVASDEVIEGEAAEVSDEM